MTEHNFDHVERCIEVFRRGGMLILVDDKDRENEGDLVIAAQPAPPSTSTSCAARAAA
jgi:3,4-dihydroxy 2-butanone 4-phosphate synthase/GTP cyclohydrolase II